MKIARAWSVGDEKGVVSWVAIQSREGTDSRGNLAAWASGTVKSRQRRQEDVEGTAWGRDFGLVDWSFVMSGRDETGTGGGAPDLGGDGLGAWPLVPFAGAWTSGLFMPYDSADLAGIGGGRSGETSAVVIPDTGPVGLLEGSDGVVGGGLISTVATLEVDLVASKGTLALSTSLYPGNAFDFSIS